MTRHHKLFGRMRKDWETMRQVCLAAGSLIDAVNFSLGTDTTGERWLYLKETVRTLNGKPPEDPPEDDNGIKLTIPPPRPLNQKEIHL